MYKLGKNPKKKKGTQTDKLGEIICVFFFKGRKAKCRPIKAPFEVDLQIDLRDSKRSEKVDASNEIGTKEREREQEKEEVFRFISIFEMEE